jgi:hypothetical protein
MNCVEWEERIALYTGGELAGEDAAEVERHVGQCLGCQVFASGMRQSLEFLTSAHQDVPDPAHFAAVRARVLSEIRGTSRRYLWPVIAAVAAAAAILLVMLRPHPVRKPDAPQPVVAHVPAPEPPLEPAVRVARHRRKAPRRRAVVVAKAQPRHEETKPLVVKLVTDDPNVVIYWISENPRGE